MSGRKSGASIRVDTAKPSLDLAALAMLACKNLSPSEASGWAGRHFVTMRHGNGQSAITVSPCAVVSRMMIDPEFERLLDENKGFLRDVRRPVRREALKMGGRLVPDSGGKLRDSLETIARAVSGHLMECQNKIRNEGGKIAPLYEQSGNLTQRAATNISANGCVNARLRLPDPAAFSVSNCAFSQADTNATRQEVARHMTSSERVADGRRIDDLLSSIREYFVRYRRQDPDEVDEEIAQWRIQAYDNSSQLGRFVFLLADESLSRVRFAASIIIMKALASAADRGKPNQVFLAEHVRRVNELYSSVVERQDADPHLDLQRQFGVDTSLSSELINATFWKILPAWPEAEAQLFEEINKDPDDYGVRREVGYGFKVNGWHPQDGCFAFEARVNQAAGEVLQWLDPENERVGLRVGRRLAELIVLDAVIPGGRWADKTPVEAIDESIARIASHTNAEQAVIEIQEALLSRKTLMSDMADGMITLLKARVGREAIARAVRQPMQFYVNVSASILNKTAVASGCKSPLVQSTTTGPNDDEKIQWFKAIRITSDHANAGPTHLFSFGIEVKIADKALRLKSPTPMIGMAERLVKDGSAALVIWAPVEMIGDKARPPANPMFKAWRSSARTVVDITYDRGMLSFSSDKADDISMRRAAAIRITFAMLTLVGLECVLGKSAKLATGAGTGNWSPWLARICMMRLQYLRQDEAAWNTADSSVYAISQAVEHVLGRHMSVRLQGLALKDDLSWRYRASKSFDALLSAFDYRMSVADAKGPEKVGVLNFTSRPCDAGKESSNGSRVIDEATMHVILGRSYLAIRNGTELDLRRLPNIHGVRSLDDSLVAPPAICESVRKLREQGCKHVVLIGHKFSGRSMGRSTLRHSHHENLDFLTSIAERFPDVRFYPMVRDTMRVVRTEDKPGGTPLEVVGLEDHKGRFVDTEFGNAVRHGGLAPIYSIATMKYVRAGEGQGQRPQSSMAIYYLHATSGLDEQEGLLQSKADLVRDTPERHAVVSALRAIHYMESEAGVQNKVHQPVVEAAKWMDVTTIEAAGEIQILERSRRAAGRVEMNMVAVLSAVSDVMDTIHG